MRVFLHTVCITLLLTLLAGCATDTYVSDENIDKFDDLSVKKFLIAEIQPTVEPEKKIYLSLVSHFDFDQSILKPEDIAELDDFIAKVINLKGHIVIAGHTDYQGSDDYNEKLSFRRSTVIQQYLSTRIPIENYTFDVAYFGENNPIVKAHSLKANALNRRGIVIFTQA